MEETLEQKLKSAFQTSFPGSELRLEASNRGRIGGVLVWDGFRDLEQIERQEHLWKVLHESLTRAERARITMILSVTPRELELVEEDERTETTSERQESQVNGRAVEGFRPDAAFAAICNALSSRAEHVAQVVTGASCEPWLNAEAGAALNFASPSVLPASTVVLPEKRHRDLPVFRIGTTDGWIALIEAKVVYPWDDGKIRRTISRLIDQVEDAQAMRSNATVFGIVYAVWTTWWSEDMFSAVPDEPHKPNDNSEAFFQKVREILGRLSEDRPWIIGDSKVVVPSVTLEFGGRTVEVGLTAFWIERSQAPSMLVSKEAQYAL